MFLEGHKLCSNTEVWSYTYSNAWRRNHNRNRVDKRKAFNIMADRSTVTVRWIINYDWYNCSFYDFSIRYIDLNECHHQVRYCTKDVSYLMVHVLYLNVVYIDSVCLYIVVLLLLFNLRKYRTTSYFTYGRAKIKPRKSSARMRPSGYGRLAWSE